MSTQVSEPEYPPAKARRIGTWTYFVSYVAPGGVAGIAMPARPCPIDDENEVLNVQGWIRSKVPGAVIMSIVLLKRRRFARYKPAESPLVRRNDPVLNY